MKYLWSEDSTSGYDFWNLVNNFYFHNEFKVEKSYGNSDIIGKFEYFNANDKEKITNIGSVILLTQGHVFISTLLLVFNNFICVRNTILLFTPYPRTFFLNIIFQLFFLLFTLH